VNGTLTIAGTAPIAGTYVVDVTKGKTRKMHVSLTLPTGAFSQALRLPATLTPGTYQVSLLPTAAFVQSASSTAKLSAPREGVVDVAFLSGTRRGKAAHTLRNAHAVWASYHFAAVPKGKLTLTWYRTVKGKRIKQLSTSLKPRATVTGSLPLHGRRGPITAVLARAGKVIAQASVTAR
jgi:hypothetical protein